MGTPSSAQLLQQNHGYFASQQSFWAQLQLPNRKGQADLYRPQGSFSSPVKLRDPWSQTDHQDPWPQRPVTSRTGSLPSVLLERQSLAAAMGTHWPRSLLEHCGVTTFV